MRWSGVRNSTRGAFWLGLQRGRAAASSWTGGWRVCAKVVSWGLKGVVAVGDLPRVELERCKVLAQRQQLLGAVVAGQRRDELRCAGFATTVAMGRQPQPVAHCGQHIPHDCQAADAGEVAEHRLQVEIHLGQGLLPPVNAGGSGFHQGLAMAHIAAHHHELAGGTQAGMEQAHTMQLLQPLAVLHVALAPAHVVHLVGID
jgi:hypothetical protein